MAIEMMDQANADLKMKMLLFDREESKRYSRYIINAPLRRLEKIKQKLKDKIKENKENKVKLKEKDEKLNQTEARLGEANRKLEQAAEKATKEAIKKLIQTCKAFDDTKEQTVKKIMHAYILTKDDAAAKVEQYWKNNN